VIVSILTVSLQIDNRCYCYQTVINYCQSLLFLSINRTSWVILI